jgi:hypothetical protein
MATPPGTETHKVIPHIEVVNSIVETLGFRNIAVHRDQYSVSNDGNKMFGLMELEHTFEGCRFAIGLRNSHDKTMRLALTVGYRVFVCDNVAFNGDFTPLDLPLFSLPVETWKCSGLYYRFLAIPPEPHVAETFCCTVGAEPSGARLDAAAFAERVPLTPSTAVPTANSDGRSGGMATTPLVCSERIFSKHVFAYSSGVR